MTKRIYGGFSVKGIHHSKNDDSFDAGKFSDGYYIGLSDGLGSCPLSHIGSQLLVRILAQVVAGINPQKETAASFAVQINQLWCQKINESGYEVRDCLATALFAVVFESAQTVWLSRLGDGVIVALTDKGSVVLCDSKEMHFCNETNSLGEINAPWEVKEIKGDWVKAIFLWSDGVSTEGDISEIESIANGLFEEYCGKSRLMVEKDLSQWIPEFPGNDDKTLVFLIAGEQTL